MTIDQKLAKLIRLKSVIKHPNSLYQVPYKIWAKANISPVDVIFMPRNGNYTVKDWADMIGGHSRDKAVIDEVERTKNRFKPRDTFGNPIDECMIDAMVEEAVDLVVDCEETDEEFFNGVYK